MAGREKQDAVDIWLAGVAQVRGDVVTGAAMGHRSLSNVSNVLAVGKAASAMVAGAAPFLSSSANVLLVTKYGHVHSQVNLPGAEMIEAGHPIPDRNSLLAGERAISFVRAVPENEELVVLVSGGASALLESLPGDLDIAALQQINEFLVSQGYAIDEINRVRTRYPPSRVENCCHISQGSRCMCMPYPMCLRTISKLLVRESGPVGPG